MPRYPSRPNLWRVARATAIALGCLAGMTGAAKADHPPLQLWDQLGVIALKSVSSACRLNLPPDSFEFDAVGVAQSPQTFDPSSPNDVEALKRPRTQRIDVTATERPVVLLLSSRYETTWDIHKADEARIAGVIFVGNGPMHIGDKATVAGATVIDASQRGVCAQDLEAIYDSKHFKTLNALAEMIAGKPLTTFQGRLTEGPFVVGPGAMDVARLQPPDPALAIEYPEETFDGLKPLIAAGKIRIATAAEIYEWQTQDPELSHYGLVKDRNRQIYRIQEPIELPLGMTGSNARFFLVPAGVPLPTGDWGDSVIAVVEPIQGCGKLGSGNICLDPYAVQGARGSFEPLPDWAHEGAQGSNTGRQVRSASADPCRIENLPEHFDLAAIEIERSMLQTGLWATTPLPDSAVPRDGLALIGTLKIASDPEPIVLLLTSRKWVRWDIDNSAGRRIEAIVLAGPAPAMISGLRAGDQPVIINAALGGTCAQPASISADMFRNGNLKTLSTQMVGRVPDRFLRVPAVGTIEIGAPSNLSLVVLISSTFGILAAAGWFAYVARRTNQGTGSQYAVGSALPGVESHAASGPIPWVQVAAPPIVLIVGVVGAMALGATALRLALALSVLYLLVIALWSARRGATALRVAGTGEHAGTRAAAWVRYMRHQGVSAYVAGLCLLAGSLVQLFAPQPAGDSSSIAWSALVFLLLGILAVSTTSVTLLAIWRKTGSAGWISQTTAQMTGVAVLVFAAMSAPSNSDLPSNGGLFAWWKPEYPFTWYGLPIDARYVWLGVVGVLIGLALAALDNSWRDRPTGLGPFWMKLLFLLLVIGLLSGCSSITGPHLPHWLVGAFIVGRLTTYVSFLFEPKDPGHPGWRGWVRADRIPGWLIAYLLTTMLGTAGLAFSLYFNYFGMLMHPAINSLTMPIGLSSRIWSYYIAFWLFLSRDLLFLLWLNAIRPRKWNDLLGLTMLVLLYPLAASARALGFGFVVPALVPGFILEPIDLVVPVASVLVLLGMLYWARRMRGESA